MRFALLFIEALLAACTIADRHYVGPADANTDSEVSDADDGEPCKPQIVWLNRDGTPSTTDLWIVDLDGMNKRPLTVDAHLEESPSWSPSGDHLVYRSQDAIWIMNADGSDAHAVTPSGYNPAWSPDGRYVAYVDGGTLWSLEVASGFYTQLTIDESPNGIEYSWSPDGSRIAFHSDYTGNREVYVMLADGTGQTNVTNNPSNDGGPIWSPDGTKILFFSYRNGGVSDLWTMDPDGTDLFELNAHTGDVLLTHQWFPNSFQVLFSEYGGSPTLHFEIATINADSSGYALLSTPPVVDFHPFLSSDKRIVWIAGSAVDDTGVWITDPDLANPRLLTSQSGFNESPHLRQCSP